MFHKVVNFVSSAALRIEHLRNGLKRRAQLEIISKLILYYIFSLLQLYSAIKILTSNFTLSPNSDVREIKPETLSFLLYNTSFRPE